MIISRDILRKVNSLKNNENDIYSFQCENGQDFYILTEEQLNLILERKMILRTKNESNRN